MASAVIKLSSWCNIRKIESDLDTLLEKEEIFWKQRSHENWLKSGDRNSKYFHSRASSRQTRNKIPWLFDSTGNLVDDQDGIGRVVVDHFGDVFQSSNPSPSDIEKFLRCVEPCLADNISAILDARFSMEDVRTAVFDMHPI